MSGDHTWDVVVNFATGEHFDYPNVTGEDMLNVIVMYSANPNFSAITIRKGGAASPAEIQPMAVSVCADNSVSFIRGHSVGRGHFSGLARYPHKFPWQLTCHNCGSCMSDADIRAHPTALSCCPERDMRWRYRVHRALTKRQIEQVRAINGDGKNERKQYDPQFQEARKRSIRSDAWSYRQRW